MGQAAQLTPMFRQYKSHKREHPDAILLFRMGDFYEMFFEDAERAAGLLELALTARGKGTGTVVPMCGFPHHQLDAYAARLVRANHRVAICEQVEDPKAAKGLVRREVVRVITPGTVNDPAQLEAKANAWLAAAAVVAGRPGAAWIDVSTGEFHAWEPGAGDDEPWGALHEVLRAVGPRELVHPEGVRDHEALERLARETGGIATPTEPWAFVDEVATPLLQQQFGVASLDGFGLGDAPAARAAAGGLLQYVQDTQKFALQHVDGITRHEPARQLLLDPATRRNLEIERSLRDGGRAGSLFQAVDATVTAPGGRLLRRWLLAPLLDPAEIAGRQDAVEELFRGAGLRGELRDRLTGVQDVERLLARTVAGSASPRELVGLGASLERVPAMLASLADARAGLLCDARDRLDPCEDVAALIRSALVDQPPASMRDGGVIRQGHSAELDELRAIRTDGRGFIARLEATERERTGIGSLKIRFNKVFGYFIEVSRANLDRVPEHYQRKQTIANGERYVTSELKEHEAKVLQAQERIEGLESELYQALRQQVAGHARRLKEVARFVALLDVTCGLAELAAARGYVRPRVDDGLGLRIIAGRHPVVEQALLERRFVPNDTELASGGRAIGVLTGPNMGGKSTYLRQVALIALLAQCGSFVPAEEAELGVVDRIFCRVGASDNLTEGQSTFMVEMAETANILNHATSRSLLLLDEIGRGTSTFDGLSIAWAVVEHLAAVQPAAPRTLFATHYHELTELAVELESVANLRMAVREWGDRVVFLHRVESGASDRSYGIHVARLAGIPARVVERARQVLANLERDEYGRDGHPRLARGGDGPEGAGGRGGGGQRSLFELASAAPTAGGQDGVVTAAEREVLAELHDSRPEELTPLEALQRLADWRGRLRDPGSGES